VFAIIEKFLMEYKPEIIFYKTSGTREKIYNKMFNKINMLDYIKADGVMNTFITKKEFV